ncbi:MAG: dTDP-glucose 4,6-dehydratase [Pseudomonadota bacterium]
MTQKTILLTGCAGFIGSNFVKTICLLPEVKKEYQFFIIDALTYAGHYPNIAKEIENNSHLQFQQIDICNREAIRNLFQENDFHGVIHFAAESHVDRSIDNPNIFVETNVLGTLNLLNESLRTFSKNADFRFLQVGTDEVYGSLNMDDPPFTEDLPLKPNSPYSASKASADLLVRSFYKTYKLPTLITRCSNNYGPYQFPEKLIPLMISNAQKNLPLPVYGKGANIRDWIYVDDHNRGIWQCFLKGRIGEVYNFGGNAEINNLDLVKMLLNIMGKSENLITFVTDRLGHDLRYAINFNKAYKEFGWQPKYKLADGIQKTVEWYQSNRQWVEAVKKV